ncbi:MAG TPA: ankyrin repeat domain-containing protein [Steroidobacteraceae bacterium]|nr:ankyrin repeat domain-containing protein [Steroidobacteraceae bacterium]
MLSAVADHLLQSTLFAVGVGILTLVLRRHSARVRFGLWLSASVKFLVPFALLTEVGSHFPRQPPKLSPITGGAQAVSTLIDSITAPLSGIKGMISLAPVPASGHLLLSLLGIVWACGVVAVAAYWLMGWHRIRRAIVASDPAALDFPIPVRTSTVMHEPAVVGILHPVLLVPVGIEDWLSAGQLRAVLAHERCHVRRRDNLTAALHMVVEAVFWFHPLVWWLGTRLIAERERACDEAVLAGGHKAKDYAAGILRVCQNYLESPLRCAAGVGGGNLTRRIEGILDRRGVVGLSALQMILLSGIGSAVVAAPIVSGHMAAPLADRYDSSSTIFRNYEAIIPAPTPPSDEKDLVVAAANGNLAQVRSLVHKGVNIESLDGAYTALTQAAQGGNETVVQELLADGAEVEHRRMGGETALILAAGMGHVSAAKRLLDAGAQINDKSDSGDTALMVASAGGYQEVVRLLLSRGADVRPETRFGDTALLLGARSGNAVVVRLLLDFGADFRHRRFDGETALDLAAQGRNVAVVETLLQKGAGSKP